MYTVGGKINIMELQSGHIVMAEAASSSSNSNWVKLVMERKFTWSLRPPCLTSAWFHALRSTIVMWAHQRRWPKTKSLSAAVRLSQRPFVDLQKDEEITDGALNY